MVTGPTVRVNSLLKWPASPAPIAVWPGLAPDDEDIAPSPPSAPADRDGELEAVAVCERGEE
jgi:hypothetical protein